MILQLPIQNEYEVRRQAVAVKDELHLTPASLKAYQDFCLSIGVAINVNIAKGLIEILTVGEKR